MASNGQEVGKALRHLRRADPILRRIIQQAGPYTVRPQRDRFNMLVSSILAQQISGKAARSIRARLVAHLAPDKLSADSLSRLTPEVLRSLGISRPKATYLLDLATRVASGQLRLERMGRLSNDAVIHELVQIKGIGVWTAQMFLIFALGRLDVFPHDDLGVRTAIRNLYALEDLPDKATCVRIAEPWKPYATVASWYCWRSLEIARREKDSLA